MGFIRGVTLDFSRPSKPTDNVYIESFNRKSHASLNANWFLNPRIPAKMRGLPLLGQILEALSPIRNGSKSTWPECGTDCH